MNSEAAYIVIVIFIASLSRSSLGFGDGLIAMPLLTIIMPPRIAAPIVALAATTTAALVLMRQWRQVHFTAASRVLIAGIIGIPIGVWFLHFGYDRFARGMLATVIIGFSLWSLQHAHRARLKTDRWSPAFGFAAGLLSGAYNTGGPPVVIYGTLRDWKPDQFRATLQSYTAVSASWVVAMHCLSGLMTADVFENYLYAFPAIVAASLIGPRLTRRLSNESFVRFVYWALLAIGVSLMIACMAG